MNSQEKNYSIDVIIEELDSHPVCAHGPTLLFCRNINKDGTKRNFFACSAYRDRKGCPFFLWADEHNRKKSSIHKIKISEEYCRLVPAIDHNEYFLQLRKIRETQPLLRYYCHTCNKLFVKSQSKDHTDHNISNNISSEMLDRPMSLLTPLNENKKEAQYLFTQESVNTIVNIPFKLGYCNLLCIGAPLIHEHVQNLPKDTSVYSSLLLDIDSRFHSFYSPKQFCWYNSFNHHFFNNEGKNTFHEFLKKDGGKKTCVIMDPPFGGRLEPLSQTLNTISSTVQLINDLESINGISIPVMLIMPYFMEPLIKVHMPGMIMCDYKVTYRNHNQFKNNKSKQGSIVRIFTNIPLSKITLPSNDYKFCEICEYWVSKENTHCYICNSCTSKDGRTYVHCKLCDRCVKPTWLHCKVCKKCCLPIHTCGDIWKKGLVKSKEFKMKVPKQSEQKKRSGILNKAILKKKRKTKKHSENI